MSRRFPQSVARSSHGRESPALKNFLSLPASSSAAVSLLRQRGTVMKRDFGFSACVSYALTSLDVRELSPRGADAAEEVVSLEPLQTALSFSDLISRMRFPPSRGNPRPQRSCLISDSKLPLRTFPERESYLVDPASSHMLVSKIKPCMSKYMPY